MTGPNFSQEGRGLPTGTQVYRAGLGLYGKLEGYTAGARELLIERVQDVALLDSYRDAVIQSVLEASSEETGYFFVGNPKLPVPEFNIDVNGVKHLGPGYLDYRDRSVILGVHRAEGEKVLDEVGDDVLVDFIFPPEQKPFGRGFDFGETFTTPEPVKHALLAGIGKIACTIDYQERSVAGKLFSYTTIELYGSARDVDYYGEFTSEVVHDYFTSLDKPK